uniref:Putative calcineurin-like phosphoesterase n=1 Tax=uncultured marine microorganism HF4000_010I05 TaxID=455517 RepID=B3T1I6_9ZZZZ|nr:putative calcineurin-like phosphoesterase [uncultured marine microorganism HF4000_010I05]
MADIHSNLEALTAVVDDAKNREFDLIWCLGDSVGYGPDPGPCLKLLRSYEFLGVAGNHDYAAVGKRSADDFNYAAKAAILWTSGQLSEEESEFLAGLPTMVTSDPFTLVHGSLRDHLNEYLMAPESARATLEKMQTQFCLVGHSHYPFICREHGASPEFHQFTEDEVCPLGDERLIINPGGVGQPRDRDSRPSYAIYDSQAMTIQRHRVTYDIQLTQEKMSKAGLPDYLIERLNHGI